MSSDEFKKSEFGKLFWSRISNAEDWNAKFRESIRKMPEKLRPPSVYIAKGVRPFECCTYREWSVLKEVDLVDKPMGTKVVARFSPGEKVQGLTGEVHVRPVGSRRWNDRRG